MRDHVDDGRHRLPDGTWPSAEYSAPRKNISSATPLITVMNTTSNSGPGWRTRAPGRCTRAPPEISRATSPPTTKTPPSASPTDGAGDDRALVAAARTARVRGATGRDATRRAPIPRPTPGSASRTTRRQARAQRIAQQLRPITSTTPTTMRRRITDQAARCTARPWCGCPASPDGSADESRGSDMVGSCRARFRHQADQVSSPVRTAAATGPGTTSIRPRTGRANDGVTCSPDRGCAACHHPPTPGRCRRDGAGRPVRSTGRAAAVGQRPRTASSMPISPPGGSGTSPRSPSSEAIIG